jgi:protein-S-isoprenylcysteine O-methyltransferase Ste14
MTVGHLLLAIGSTGYILVAVLFEERDLVDALSSDYATYRERTTKFFPRLNAWHQATRVRDGGT